MKWLIESFNLTCDKKNHMDVQSIQCHGQIRAIKLLIL